MNECSYVIGRRVFRYRVVRPLRPAGLKLEEDELNPETTDRKQWRLREHGEFC